MQKFYRILLLYATRRHRYAKNIRNVSWGTFVSFLHYKAESAGFEVVDKNPRNTTQECSRCGYIKIEDEALDTSGRIFHCNKCELTIGRDVNAAINILKRAT